MNCTLPLLAAKGSGSCPRATRTEGSMPSAASMGESFLTMIPLGESRSSRTFRIMGRRCSMAMVSVWTTR